MTTPTRVRLVLFGLLLTILGVQPRNAGAVIIVNDAALTPNMWMNDYVLNLTQSIPIGDGLFAISINALGGNDWQFRCQGIAEYYALYSTAPGTAITPAFAQTSPPLVVNFSPGPFQSTVNIPLNNSVLLGYWDDRMAFDRTPNAEDNYGWVEIRNTPSGLSVVDGATAIGVGIYAGTYTQIPEPGTLALVCAGAVALLLRIRREQSGRT